MLICLQKTAANHPQRNVMENKTNILKKLHAIMSEVSFIEKDKKNDFHGYAYASEQAIKQTIHPLLVKHGVLFTIAVDNTSQHALTVTTQKGQSTSNLTEARIDYHFYDVESGEVLSGTFVGMGEDKGDKGLYKAITGAIKYILTSTFLIPTGDDPENEKPAKKAVKSNYQGVNEFN